LAQNDEFIHSFVVVIAIDCIDDGFFSSHYLILLLRFVSFCPTFPYSFGTPSVSIIFMRLERSGSNTIDGFGVLSHR